MHFLPSLLYVEMARFEANELFAYSLLPTPGVAKALFCFIRQCQDSTGEKQIVLYSNLS